MASLVFITKETRLLLKIGGAILGGVILIFLIFKGGEFLQKSFFPEPPPPAEKKFGDLPPIQFPISNGAVGKYNIDTASGFLPTFSPTINVYILETNEPTITALPDARIRAAQLGYLVGEQEMSASEYRWVKPQNNSVLMYDIFSLNFSVNGDYKSLPNTSPISGLNKQNIFSAVTGFVTALGGNTKDIDFKNSTFTYYSTTPEGITPVSDPASAILSRVDLYQNKVNEMKIYYPAPNNSTLYFTVANAGGTTVIVDASFHHFSPVLSDHSTYPLKTADEAFSDLQSGKGFIVAPSTQDEVDITEVALGYYLDNNENQKYLQPIVVFKGKNGFLAYVQATKN